MRHAVCPALRVGLSTLDWADIVGLAVVVPSNDFHDINYIPVLYQGRPSLLIGPVVCEVYPLVVTESMRTTLCNGGQRQTHILIVRLRRVMREEPRANRSHVRLVCTIDLIEPRDVLLVGREDTDVALQCILDRW